MSKILLAEDDLSLNRLVCATLRAEGYEVTSCADGNAAADEFGKDKYDLVITDIMMPKLDGFALAELIRSADEHVPILFMTARDDKPSKQLGFKLGIDDYITKPFDIDIFVLKIKAVLRRSAITKTNQIEVGNLVLNADEHTAYVDGKELSLTVREFDILFKLLSYPKKTFTRAQLMQEFWDYDSSSTSRTVDVYMVKLREKTADCTGFEIVTVHGLGYKAVIK
ncbi:MAG TPA: response regulator transcription factor [Candidatus Coproplasma avicola]|uniref:Heme response regulator HssR n=1 Tax=Candidatus Coproplasma avicola TaxID=2840744 RepID=A0A9D1J952_9FIRM|nr:response regulator transcription factor [Candidatus Coproplasma avicola]